MDWKNAAIEDLKRFGAQKASLDNILARIQILQDRYQSVRASAVRDVPVRGGGKLEDAMLDNIVERERLALNYEAARRMVELVACGLGGLSAAQRRVLEVFYTGQYKNGMGLLTEELGYSDRQIYRMRDDALYLFTVLMYGVTEY